MVVPSSSQDAFDEVFRSANVFFDAVESATIFTCITELVENGKAELAAFIVENFNIDQADPTHIAVLQLSILVADMIIKRSDDAAILAKLLSRLIVILSPNDNITNKQYQGYAVQLTESTSNVVVHIFESNISIGILPSLSHCLDRMLQLSVASPTTQTRRLVDCVRSTFATHRKLDSDTFAIVDALGKIMESILQVHVTRGTNIPSSLLDLLPILVSQNWTLLGTDTPQYHVAAVEHIWKIQDLTTEHDIVESSVLGFLSQGSYTGSAESQQDSIDRFATLFQHSRTVRRASDDFVPPTLRRACLRIVDECKDLDRHEPGVQWLIGLHSLSPVFKLIFGEPEHAAAEFRAVLPPSLVARTDFSTLRLEPCTFTDAASRGSPAAADRRTAGDASW